MSSIDEIRSRSILIADEFARKVIVFMPNHPSRTVLNTWFHPTIERALRQAIQEEREACAQIAEHSEGDACRDVASAIRARPLE